MKINHCQWWAIITNQGPMLHGDKDCVNMKKSHGQPCPIIISSHGHIMTHIFSWPNSTLTQPWSSVVNHGSTSHCNKVFQYQNQSWSTKVNHGQHAQPWSNVILWKIFFQYENQSWSTMVQHLTLTNIISILKSTMVNNVAFRVYNLY